MTRLLHRSLANILTVFRVWAPDYSTRPIHTNPGDIMIAVLAVLLVQAVSAFLLYGHLSVQLLFSGGGIVVVYVAAATLVVLAFRLVDQVASVAVGLLWAIVFGTMLSHILSDGMDLYDIWTYAKFATLPFLLPCFAFLLGRLGAFRGSIAAFATALPAVLYLGEWAMMSFLARHESAPEVASLPYSPDTEMIYARQPDLMQAATQGLRVSDPAKVELFAVLGAGFSQERVFRREVEAVGHVLEQSFGAKDRVVRLVNDRTDATRHPLMNRVNLGEALDAVGDAMGEEDLALLFLTSHGAPGRFSLSYPGVISRDLSVHDINAALEQAGIERAVLIVSACYSGSFADALSRPDRLVLTASAADRNSFGCSDENQWTDWGRAFFTEGLAEHADPRRAAERAQELVAIWESERGLTPSQPVILEGTEIGAVLDQWLDDLEPGQSVQDALAVHATTRQVGSVFGQLLPED